MMPPPDTLPRLWTEAMYLRLLLRHDHVPPYDGGRVETPELRMRLAMHFTQAHPRTGARGVAAYIMACETKALDWFYGDWTRPVCFDTLQGIVVADVEALVARARRKRGGRCAC